MTGLAPEGGAWGGGPSMFSFQKIFGKIYIYISLYVCVCVSTCYPRTEPALARKR